MGAVPDDRVMVHVAAAGHCDARSEIRFEVRLTFFICLTVICVGCSRLREQPANRPQLPRAAGGQYVIVVSFDGFRHDYVARFRPPAMMRLAESGVRATSLIPVFPSKTFPNHYSIATGLYPERHGIVANSFFDPDRRSWFGPSYKGSLADSSWYGGEPIWVVAERSGVRTASFAWPHSDAAIQGVRPTHWRPYDTSITKTTRVNEVARWLRLPSATRPRLVMLYFEHVDEAGHDFGPATPEVAAAITDADAALGVLLDSIAMLPIRDSINLILLSDHGMTSVTPDRVIALTEVLGADTLSGKGIEVSGSGPTMSVWFGRDSARMHRTHALLQQRLVHAKAYLRSAIPPRWHVWDNVRTGDILIVAEEGYELQRRRSTRPPSRGNHGYDPALPSMQGIFIASGSGIRRGGEIASFENIHIYPLVARLLGLRAIPRIDGRMNVLAPILATPGMSQSLR